MLVRLVKEVALGIVIVHEQERCYYIGMVQPADKANTSSHA